MKLNWNFLWGIGGGGGGQNKKTFRAHCKYQNASVSASIILIHAKSKDSSVSDFNSISTSITSVAGGNQALI